MLDDGGGERTVGSQLLAAHGPARALFLARLPFLLLAAALAVLLYFWGRQLLGETAALAALFLYTLSPAILGHGYLATMDVGLAAFTVFFCFALWRYLERPDGRHIAACGIAMGLMLCTKFSAVFLLPVAVVLLLAAGKAPRRPRILAYHLVLMGAIASLVIQALYLSPGGLYLYSLGISRVNADHNPDYLVFLAGQLEHSFPTYFAAAWLLKEPLAALLLTGIGLYALRSAPARVKWFLLLPPAVVFAAHTALADNLGVRYIIPMLPFEYLIGGSGRRLAALPRRRGTRGRRRTRTLARGRGLRRLPRSPLLLQRGGLPGHPRLHRPRWRNPLRPALARRQQRRLGPIAPAGEGLARSQRQRRDRTPGVLRLLPAGSVRGEGRGDGPVAVGAAYGPGNLPGERAFRGALSGRMAASSGCRDRARHVRLSKIGPPVAQCVFKARGSAFAKRLTFGNARRADIYWQRTRMRPGLLLLLAAHFLQAQPSWWITEPVRWVQTNLRETDAALDPHRLVEQLAAMRANVVLMGMGGIAAYYPTHTEFHYPSPYLPAGRDMFGDVLREAHARGIRVVGRFDFSKTQKAVYDAHPEWFFRRSDGEPVIYNGLYSTCINGGYYREQAMKILAEGAGALRR